MDRGMKKWRPFNSVVPAKELLKKNINVSLPSLSKDEIEEFEEKIKASLYTHSLIEITYYENNELKTISDYVIRLDPIRKNIYLNNTTINFRQIYKIK